jgi:hypothetical protein
MFHDFRRGDFDQGFQASQEVAIFDDFFKGSSGFNIEVIFFISGDNIFKNKAEDSIFGDFIGMFWGVFSYLS